MVKTNSATRPEALRARSLSSQTRIVRFVLSNPGCLGCAVSIVEESGTWIGFETPPSS